MELAEYIEKAKQMVSMLRDDIFMFFANKIVIGIWARRDNISICRNTY